MLYTMFLGKDDTPLIIYIVAGFLTAMFAWQVQTFWRNILLRKHINKRKSFEDELGLAEDETPLMQSIATNELLPEADLSDIVPNSITENTTKKLKQKVKHST